VKKRYGQYCPVAHALDLVGERWSLLIVRELMLGQRRYTDLAEALPGLGTNILAARLRDLEGGGVVRKTKLPRPASVTVYELTDYGRELDGVLRALAHWGARSLGSPQQDDCWSMYAVHTRFRRERAIDGSYEIRFEGEPGIAVVVEGGEVDAWLGEAPAPQLVVDVQPGALHELIEAKATVRKVLDDGRATILTGTAQQLEQFVAMFVPEAPAAAAAA
jgi:DNA-binding HxlR family transcriptional regulator